MIEEIFTRGLESEGEVVAGRTRHDEAARIEDRGRGEELAENFPRDPGRVDEKKNF